MQFIPISAVPQTNSGGAKAHYYTERRDSRNIREIYIYIYINTSEKHSHTGQLMDGGGKESHGREKSRDVTWF